MTNKEIDKKEFGRYLRELRGDRSTRQVEIATGVSNSYISLIERGMRDIPSPDILKKLSHAYGVSYDELMQKAGYVSDALNLTDIIVKALSVNNKDLDEELANKIFEEIIKNYSENNLSVDDKVLISKVAHELGKKTPEADILRKMLKSITE